MRTLAATQRGRERNFNQVDKKDNWACPGCAHLYYEQKQKDTLNPLIKNESINKELVHVTWNLTWEPEEAKDTLPNLLECIQDFETRVDEPDIFLPTADQALEDLEIQSFDPGLKN